MNYPYYGNPYMPPMQDNLAQLRQQQMQAIPPMPQNPLPQSGVQAPLTRRKRPLRNM